jgi:hypothetical protein
LDKFILSTTNYFSGALVTNIRHTPAHWEKHTVEDNPPASTDMAESGAQAGRGNITSHQNFNETRDLFSIQKRLKNFEIPEVPGPPPAEQPPRRSRPNHDDYRGKAEPPDANPAFTPAWINLLARGGNNHKNHDQVCDAEDKEYGITKGLKILRR